MEDNEWVLASDANGEEDPAPDETAARLRALETYKKYIEVFGDREPVTMHLAFG